MNKLECQICQQITKTYEGLANHVKKHIIHNELESKIEYYNKYFLESENEKYCPTCKLLVPFISLKQGYKDHCSHKCSINDPDVIVRRKENQIISLMNKYGVTNSGQIPSHMEKVRSTNMKNHGVENYVNAQKGVETNKRNHNGVFSTGTREYKEKRTKTCQEKYGVDHPMQSSIVIDKCIKKSNEKYGTDWPMQNKEIHQKSMNTSFKKYGGVLKGSPIILKKIKETNLKKYGSEFATQNNDVRKKTEETNMKKYGQICTLQNKIILQKKYGVDNTNQLEWVVEKQKVSRKQTLNNRYGVKNVSQLEWVQDNIKKSNLEKYNVESTTQLDWVQEKMKNTSSVGSNTTAQKHVDIPSQSPIVQEKMKKTNLERYGVEYPLQNEDIRNKNFESHNTSYKIRKLELSNGKTIRYQSIPELEYIQYCIANNIEIENGDKIPYHTPDNKLHYYFVDFRIKENNNYRLVEIKGTTKWYYESLNNGILNLKIQAAEKYSQEQGYFPFVMMLNCIINTTNE